MTTASTRTSITATMLVAIVVGAVAAVLLLYLVRTVWLLLLFAILVGALGAILGFAFNLSLLIVVAAIGFVYAIFSWLSAGRIVASVTGAKPADRARYPRLYHVVETVAIAAGLPQPPPIYVIDDPAPNAFAAGRSPDKAYVCVTTGLLNLMDERELE